MCYLASGLIRSLGRTGRTGRMGRTRNFQYPDVLPKTVSENAYVKCGLWNRVASIREMLSELLTRLYLCITFYLCEFHSYFITTPTSNGEQRSNCQIFQEIETNRWNTKVYHTQWHASCHLRRILSLHHLQMTDMGRHLLHLYFLTPHSMIPYDSDCKSRVLSMNKQTRTINISYVQWMLLTQQILRKPHVIWAVISGIFSHLPQLDLSIRDYAGRSHPHLFFWSSRL